MVSVIIPSYNREKTIKGSVESALNQTLCNLEVVVVDDGSTDNTLQLLEKIKDERLRIIYQDHKGACAARNKGIEAANGEYIAFHDSDDLCRPNRLEIQMQHLKDKNADFVCGNVLTHLDGKQFVSPGYKNGWLEKADDVFNITTMTFFGKTEVFNEFKFDPEMPRWQDLDLLLSMCGKVKIYFCSEILCDYYRDGDSMSLNPEKCLEAYQMILAKYPYVKENGGHLYSRLTKLYADSKVALNRRDYYEDYKITYDNNKTAVNLVWLMAARVGLADLVYKLLH